jgi:hypothetical protein
MDKPEAEKATVTIKAIETEAWEMAKRAATKRGETQGEWVSRACRAQANLEAGDGVMQPGKPDNPAPVANPYAAEVQAIAVLLTAMGAAGARPNRLAVGKANRLVNLIGAALPSTRKPRSLTDSRPSLTSDKPMKA